MFMLEIYYAVTYIIALPNICFVWIISFFAGRRKEKTNNIVFCKHIISKIFGKWISLNTITVKYTKKKLLNYVL